MKENIFATVEKMLIQTSMYYDFRDLGFLNIKSRGLIGILNIFKITQILVSSWGILKKPTTTNIF